MNTFQSLALALRGHFDKPFAQLPPHLQQRLVIDLAPWSWEGITPRQRCHRAKQWDYENDPANREVREGVDALTNPDSPAYSLDETKQLRGDFLPEPRVVKQRIDLPPLEWDSAQPPTVSPSLFGALSAANGAAASAANSIRSTVPIKTKRSNLLSPLIKVAQAECTDPDDTHSVWVKLREMAAAKTAPFIGATDEGLQWIDEHDQTNYLSLKNLRDRLSRTKKDHS